VSALTVYSTYSEGSIGSYTALVLQGTCGLLLGTYLSAGRPRETNYTVKKVCDFPVPSRDVTITKLSLAGNN
jgi:hypothetical protein